MSDSTTLDVLMRVVASGTGPGMNGDSLVAINRDDLLLADFIAGQFFELRAFEFNAGLGSSPAEEEEEVYQVEQDEHAPASRKAYVAELNRTIAASRRRVAAARGRKSSEVVDMQPASYSRLLDSASTLLFKALVDNTTLANIAVVKRKSAGLNSISSGYLRLDFKDVLITNLSWKNQDHVVVETGSFIYRKLRMQYRPQRSNGTFGPPVAREWAMNTPRTGS